METKTRVCPGCCTEKPESDFYSHAKREYNCRKCCSARRLRHYHENKKCKDRTVQTPDQPKQCAVCCLTKEPDEFGLQTDRRVTPHRTYLRSWCKSCEHAICAERWHAKSCGLNKTETRRRMRLLRQQLADKRTQEVKAEALARVPTALRLKVESQAPPTHSAAVPSVCLCGQEPTVWVNHDAERSGAVVFCERSACELSTQEYEHSVTHRARRAAVLAWNELVFAQTSALVG